MNTALLLLLILNTGSTAPAPSVLDFPRISGADSDDPLIEGSDTTSPRLSGPPTTSEQIRG